jgi:3-oxoacyl-[acyl-carrier protein] reductase
MAELEGRLAGKIALVTGAGRGIGKEVALRLARDGAFLIVHYGASGDRAEAVLAEIKSLGGEGFTACADLAEPDAAATLFAAVDAGLQSHGKQGIDILVNNAGIGLQRDVTSITGEDYDRVFAVNLRAPLFIAQEAAKRMGEGGRIINITSVVGENAFGGYFVGYGATKAALNYMTTSMAASLGPRGITVNAVAPGATATEFVGDMMNMPEVIERLKADTALRAIGQPADIASAVALIASPDSKWITGEVIRASGGAAL